ncbi:MAG: hypothetical protein LIP12_02220 [Clostridiales bacterium]|nr:hypothetical protein [Clostridiales bacterium]
MRPIFKFTQYQDMGMSDEQIEYIQKLVDEYMKKYPKIQLNRVCDFYSLDHKKTVKVDNYLYTHNDKGKLYSDVKDLALYNEQGRWIAFNHIRLAGMRLENDSEIQKILNNKKRLEEVYAKHIIFKNINPNVPPFEKAVLDKEFLPELKRYEIHFSSLSMDRMDVLWIRLIEESKFIKRLTIHELAHAISQGYNLENDSIVQSLYEEYKLGFENLKEFIAECIMAAELTDKISLANKVKARIC